MLRLVAQTGPVVKHLDDNTANQVLSRVNKIVRSGAMECMVVEWVEDSQRQGVFGALERTEKNEYMDTLY